MLSRNSNSSTSSGVVAGPEPPQFVGLLPLPELAELTVPFAKIGGTIILPKSKGIEDEVIEASAAAEVLGAAPAITIEVDKPGDTSPDNIVYWMKISPTPREFPRRVGIPHQSPLIDRKES